MIEKLGFLPYIEVDFDEADDVYCEDKHVATVLDRKYTYLYAAAPEMLELIIKEALDIEETIPNNKQLAKRMLDANLNPLTDVIETATGRTWAEVKELIDE